MRTMMRKGVIYAVFAVALLAMAALVIGCSASDSPEASGYKYQPGKGAVKLNFNKTTRTTRTIVPGTTIDSFTKFDIDFAPALSGGSGAVPAHFADVPALNVAGPYDLEPGIYDITVVGYIGTGDAAIGTVVDQNIKANTTTNTDTIYLEAYDFSEGGTGTFSWNITNTVTELTAATMSFTRIGAGSTPPSSVNLLATGRWVSSETAFPVGYFYVDFVLVAKGSTRTFRHILHIYKGQTSIFEYLFDNSYFTYAKAGLIIDYTPPSDLKPVLEADSSPVAEGDILTLSILDDDEVVIEVTNVSDYTSIQWYFNSNIALTTLQGVSGSDGEILTVTAGTAPFDAQGLKPLTVVGILTTTGAPVSKIIFIEIEE